MIKKLTYLFVILLISSTTYAQMQQSIEVEFKPWVKGCLRKVFHLECLNDDSYWKRETLTFKERYEGDLEPSAQYQHVFKTAKGSLMVEMEVIVQRLLNDQGFEISVSSTQRDTNVNHFQYNELAKFTVVDLKQIPVMTLYAPNLIRNNWEFYPQISLRPSTFR